MKTQRKAFINGIIFVFAVILVCNVVFAAGSIVWDRTILSNSQQRLDSYHGDTSNIGYDSARVARDEADNNYGETLEELRGSSNPVNRIIAGAPNVIRIPFVLLVLVVGIYYIAACCDRYMRRG